MADKNSTIKIGFQFDQSTARQFNQFLEQSTLLLTQFKAEIQGTELAITSLNNALNTLGNNSALQKLSQSGLIPTPGTDVDYGSYRPGMRYAGNNFGRGPARIGGTPQLEGGQGNIGGYTPHLLEHKPNYGASGGGGGSGGGGFTGGFNTDYEPDWVFGGQDNEMRFNPKDNASYVMASLKEEEKDERTKYLDSQKAATKAMDSFGLSIIKVGAILGTISGLVVKAVKAADESGRTTISAAMEGRATGFSLDQILGLQFGLKAAGIEGGTGGITDAIQALMAIESGAGATRGKQFGELRAALGKSGAAGASALEQIDVAISEQDRAGALKAIMQSLVLAGNDPSVDVGGIAKTLGMEQLAGMDATQMATILEFMQRGFGTDLAGSMDLRKEMVETSTIAYEALQENIDTFAGIVEKFNVLLENLRPIFTAAVDDIDLLMTLITNPAEGLRMMGENFKENVFGEGGNIDMSAAEQRLKESNIAQLVSIFQKMDSTFTEKDLSSAMMTNPEAFLKGNALNPEYSKYLAENIEGIDVSGRDRWSMQRQVQYGVRKEGFDVQVIIEPGDSFLLGDR